MRSPRSWHPRCIEPSRGPARAAARSGEEKAHDVRQEDPAGVRGGCHLHGDDGVWRSRGAPAGFQGDERHDLSRHRVEADREEDRREALAHHRRARQPRARDRRRRREGEREVRHVDAGRPEEPHAHAHQLCEGPAGHPRDGPEDGLVHLEHDPAEDIREVRTGVRRRRALPQPPPDAVRELVDDRPRCRRRGRGRRRRRRHCAGLAARRSGSRRRRGAGRCRRHRWSAHRDGHCRRRGRRRRDRRGRRRRRRHRHRRQGQRRQDPGEERGRHRRRAEDGDRSAGCDGDPEGEPPDRDGQRRRQHDEDLPERRAGHDRCGRQGLQHDVGRGRRDEDHERHRGRDEDGHERGRHVDHFRA